MIFDSSKDDINQFKIFLNGRLVRTVLAADDIEGWVMIPDITTLAPLTDENSIIDDTLPEVIEKIPSVTKFGKVVILKQHIQNEEK